MSAKTAIRNIVNDEMKELENMDMSTVEGRTVYSNSLIQFGIVSATIETEIYSESSVMDVQDLNNYKLWVGELRLKMYSFIDGK